MHHRPTALLARNFRHTRTFSFRISGTRSNDRYANDPTLDQRLYLALRDISNRTVDNIQQPTLFPNLTRAIFEPLPPLPPEVRYILSNQDGHDSQEFHPFLVAVKTVELLHRPTGNYDKAPDFHLFGMQKVEHLSIHHLFGAEISNTVDIQDYLGPQLRLRQVDFHLEDHIAWAMGSNAVNVVDAHASAATTARADNLPQQYNPFILQPVTAGGQRSLDVDWYIYEYTAALAYTVFKLAYFRKAHSTSNDTTPSHFPNLESIVIHLGDHGDSIIDEIAERTREKIAEYKKEYIDALQPDPSVSSLDEHRSSGTMPAQKSTKVEVRQRGGKTYRLVSRRASRNVCRIGGGCRGSALR